KVLRLSVADAARHRSLLLPRCRVHASTLGGAYGDDLVRSLDSLSSLATICAPTEVGGTETGPAVRSPREQVRTARAHVLVRPRRRALGRRGVRRGDRDARLVRRSDDDALVRRASAGDDGGAAHRPSAPPLWWPGGLLGARCGAVFRRRPFAHVRDERIRPR